MPRKRFHQIANLVHACFVSLCCVSFQFSNRKNQKWKSDVSISLICRISSLFLKCKEMCLSHGSVEMVQNYKTKIKMFWKKHIEKQAQIIRIFTRHDLILRLIQIYLERIHSISWYQVAFWPSPLSLYYFFVFFLCSNLFQCALKLKWSDFGVDFNGQDHW